MFFTVITALFLVVLAISALGIFFYKPAPSYIELTFNRPKVSINMDVFNLDQFKNLQPFDKMEILYFYRAMQDKQVQEGYVHAVSYDQAQLTLTNMGLEVTELREAAIGRENPFTPYYQTANK